MDWTLHYDRSVITYLYSIRDQGFDLHGQIRQLQKTGIPENALTLENRPNYYDLTILEYTVTCELVESARSIRVLKIVKSEGE